MKGNVELDSLENQEEEKPSLKDKDYSISVKKVKKEEFYSDTSSEETNEKIRKSESIDVKKSSNLTKDKIEMFDRFSGFSQTNNSSQNSQKDRMEDISGPEEGDFLQGD